MTELTDDCRKRLVSGGELRYTYAMENKRITIESNIWGIAMKGKGGYRGHNIKGSVYL